MNRKYIAWVAILVCVLGVATGWAVYTGVGPAPGGTGEPVADFPEEDDTEVLGETDVPPFSFTVDDIEECGMTCRDVSATLYNQQNETATNVTVFIRIFAGQDNTEPADLVWEGRVEVGTMAPGASFSTTERVELSLRDARMVERHGGWVTILTVVRTDERTVRFEDSERVA